VGFFRAQYLRSVLKVMVEDSIAALTQLLLGAV
jgi:hypothetical protein